MWGEGVYGMPLIESVVVRIYTGCTEVSLGKSY